MFWAFPAPTSSASGPPGALQDITLSQQTPSTWKDMALLTAMPTAQEPTGADDIDSSTSILLTREGPEGGEAVLVAEAEPGFTDREKETAHPPSETTPHPTTHRASTARATTAQGPATLHPHRDAQPDHHQISVLAEPSQLDPHTPRVEDGGPSATERAAEDGVSTQLPAGEGSGEQVSARWGPPCLLGRGWLLLPGGAQCRGLRGAGWLIWHTQHPVSHKHVPFPTVRKDHKVPPSPASRAKPRGGGWGGGTG